VYEPVLCVNGKQAKSRIHGPKTSFVTQATQIELHCQISYREGLGSSLQIMGLATINPHSHKEHTEIHKIPSFSVNQASFDTEIQPF